MNPQKICVALVFATAFVAGCVSEPRLVRPKSPATSTTPAASAMTAGAGGYVSPEAANNFGATCYQHLESRKYDKLFACVDQWETMRIPPNSREYYLRPETMSRAYRAEALIDLGDYAKAAENARTGYELSQPLPRGPGKSIAEIQNLTALTMAYALSGQQANAQQSFIRLEEIFNYYNDPRRRGKGGTTPMAQASVGRVYLAMGEYEKAIAAVEKDKTSLLDKPTVFMRQRFIKAKSLFELGRLDEAKADYSSLLDSSSFRELAGIYWITLFDLARIEEKQGNLEKAIDFYRRAIDVIEQQRSSINTEAGKIGFAGNRQAVYGRLVSALYESGRHEEAFAYAERAKARALVDILAAKQDFAVEDSNREQVLSLLAESRSMEQVAFESGGNKTREVAQIMDLRHRLRQQAPQLASLISVNAIAAPEVQTTLGTDEVLLEYYLEGSDLYAFILTREAVRGYRLEAGNVATDVGLFREALAETSGKRYLEAAQKLYGTLLRPLEGGLKPRLTIVAHGPLHYLPFSALHDGNRFLVEKYSLRLLPSASVVRFINARKGNKPGGILAFGNPDLGDARYDLQFAHEEAKAIAKTIPQSRALLRKEASESALRQYGSGFTYLHFATHGTFHPEMPLRSALMLARDTQSDGMLSADKLYSMHLGADLVTLSACETGLGKTAGGDDVLGLVRGFMYAGARSIVSSLWKVDDLATARLMTQFYGNLNKSQDRRESLRNAQLTTMKTFPHPYYWAAFQLTGSAE